MMLLRLKKGGVFRLLCVAARSFQRPETDVRVVYGVQFSVYRTLEVLSAGC